MAILNGNYREYKLNNGLVVALQSTPSQTIAAKLQMNYGSSHEQQGEEGLAHFLEHCLVTGGSRKYTPIQADVLRSSFVNLNANTSVGRTNFVAEMLSEDFENWLDFTSQQVFCPRLDPIRLDSERERVLREISDHKSNINYPAIKEFDSLVYGSHPLSKPVLGNEEVIRNSNAAKLRQFHLRGYHPNNANLIIVGGLPQNVESLIEKYFGDFAAGENTRKKFPELTPFSDKILVYRPYKASLNLDSPDESSASLTLTSLAPNTTHSDWSSFSCLVQIFGGDANSRLFQSLGLKKGLAYHVGSNYGVVYNAARMQIGAEVPATRIDEAVNSIFQEMDTLKNEKVDEVELARIKKLLKYSYAKRFETNDGHIGAIESKLDYNLTPEQILQACNAVSAESIIEAANKYFPDQNTGKYLLYVRNPLLN